VFANHDRNQALTGLLVSFGWDLTVYNDGSIVTPHARFPLLASRWTFSAQAYTAGAATGYSGVGVGVGPVTVASVSAATAYAIGQQLTITVTAPDGHQTTAVLDEMSETLEWARLWVNWLNAAGSGSITPDLRKTT
jgi:hypothetical protein